MECNELLGYITYENKEMGKCRLLDYSDEWGLADDNEKRLIRIAAAGEEMLEALQYAFERLAMPDVFLPNTRQEIMQTLLSAINKATGK